MTRAERLLATLRDDPRVVGVAHRPGRADDESHVLVVCTWDALEALSTRLAGLAAAWLDDPAPTGQADGHTYDALGRDGARVRVEVRRIGELRPSAEGESAQELHDPKGLVAQWVAWSVGRKRPAATASASGDARARAVLAADRLVRELAGPLAPGRAVLSADGGVRSLRQKTGELLRARLGMLAEAGPVLHERAKTALAGIPHPASGIRVVGSGSAARERFLAVADAEGFLGDRVLLDFAEGVLRELAGREPTFVEGYALATFDQVEARYALGEAAGGCRTPLVPGVYVGIGVTPRDALELWAAPTVAEPAGPYACVADPGERREVTRDAGRDPLLAALRETLAEAHESLPDLLRRARAAEADDLAEPRAALRALHLPATFVEAAGLHGALRPGVDRLTAALCLARAAGDMEPVVGRKLALAGGRLLLLGPAGASRPAACADG